MTHLYTYTMFKEEMNKLIIGRKNGDIKKVIPFEINDENIDELQIIVNNDSFVGAVIIEDFLNHDGENAGLIKEIYYMNDKTRHMTKIFNALFNGFEYDTIHIQPKNEAEENFLNQFTRTVKILPDNKKEHTVSYIDFYRNK